MSDDFDGPLRIEDDQRVRTFTLDRPSALNAFNEELYDALAEGLADAAEDSGVAVALLTGAGRAFCAGTDLLEMAQRIEDPAFVPGRHGFPGLIDRLTDFPKPVILAINGLGLGIGATIIGFADLVFMSADAELKCPFTSLGVAPEAASSFTFSRLVGRQQASWLLMSSEWISASQAFDMGLVWRVCPADELLDDAMRHAQVLAAKPISSLVETKRAMVAPLRPSIAAAREREDAAFVNLMSGPANLEALAAFADHREPDFTSLPPGW
jgi:enoyl-CoA hydratase/carnithine racemase